MPVQGNVFSPRENSQGGEGGDAPAPMSWDGLLPPRSLWEVPHNGGAAALPDSLPAPSSSSGFLFIPLISFPLKMHRWGLREGGPLGGNGLPQRTQVPDVPQFGGVTPGPGPRGVNQQ